MGATPCTDGKLETQANLDKPSKTIKELMKKSDHKTTSLMGNSSSTHVRVQSNLAYSASSQNKKCRLSPLSKSRSKISTIH